MGLPNRLTRRLWCRHLYRRQPACLFALGWSCRAGNSLQNLPLDFRRLYYRFVGFGRLSMDFCDPSHTLKQCHSLLLGSAGSADPVFPGLYTRRPRVEAVPRVRRIDEE